MRKTALLIFVMITFITNITSAQSKWITETEIYNGEEYSVRFTNITYVISNKKYQSYFDDCGADCSFDNETDKQYEARREDVSNKMYDILNKIFKFDSIPRKKNGLNTFGAFGIYDSKTKDLVGVQFAFDVFNKKYFPLDKIQLAERELLKAGLNLGEARTMQDTRYIFYHIRIYIRGPRTNDIIETKKNNPNSRDKDKLQEAIR